MKIRKVVELSFTNTEWKYIKKAFSHVDYEKYKEFLNAKTYNDFYNKLFEVHGYLDSNSGANTVCTVLDNLNEQRRFVHDSEIDLVL